MSDLTRLILGLLLFVLSCWYCCSYRGAAVPTAGVATPAATLATVPASFEAKLQGGKVILNGSLPNEDAKNRILSRARELYGADGFVDNTLKVSGPGVGNVQAGAGWLDWALGLLPIPKQLGGDGSFMLAPEEVTVRGTLPDQAARSKLLQGVTAVLPANVKLNDLTTVAGNVLSEAQLRVQSELNQILLKGIEFATAKADISPASAAVLDQAANALKTASDVRLEIGGHTDNVGPLPANNALSQARANAVKSYLVGKGIAANRLATKGYGPTQPIGDNNTDAGKQRNRRIEFRIAGGTATPR